MNIYQIAVAIIILYAGYKTNWKKLWYDYDFVFKLIFWIVVVVGGFIGIIWGSEIETKKECQEWGEIHKVKTEYKLASDTDDECWVIVEGGKQLDEKKIRKTTYEEIKALEAMEEK